MSEPWAYYQSPPGDDASTFARNDYELARAIKLSTYPFGCTLMEVTILPPHANLCDA